MNVSPARTLIRLWREVAWPERAPLLAGFACMVVLGLATGAYAFLTGPALRYLLTGASAGLSAHAPLLNRTFQLSPLATQLGLPLILVGLGVARGLAYLGQFYAMGWFGQRVAASLRRRVFECLLERSPLSLGPERSGDLLQRFSGDVLIVETAAAYAAASYLRDGLQLVVLAAVALALDWKLALVCGTALPLIALPTLRLSRSVLRKTRESQGHLGVLGAELQEGLRELPTLQVFGAERAAEERFARAAAAHRRALVRAGWKRAIVPALTEVVAASLLAGILAWTVAHGAASASLVSFVTTLLLMYQPAKDLGRYGQLGVQSAVAGERLLALLDAPREVADAPGAREPARLARELVLERVAFSYAGRTALRGVDLTLPMGKVTALVGPSGAGKSTVARLLVRAARATGGRILLDGVDAETLTREGVRRQVALVTQEPLLFSGTVRENLLLARPEATRDELERACRAADAHGFITALPQGYDTPLGERGGGLSGGQRQRVCLARALLADAPLLVLDEATASLDPESEREVQNALDRLLPGRSALVIAHRLASVQKADVICVLSEGQVVEQGTHAELLARGGAYANLWRGAA